MARLQEQDQQHLIAIQLDAMRDQITNLQSRMDWLWGMMGVAGLGIAAISALSCYLYFRKEEKRERLIPQIGAVKWNEYCWHLT